MLQSVMESEDVDRLLAIASANDGEAMSMLRGEFEGDSFGETSLRIEDAENMALGVLADDVKVYDEDQKSALDKLERKSRRSFAVEYKQLMALKTNGELKAIMEDRLDRDDELDGEMMKMTTQVNIILFAKDFYGAVAQEFYGYEPRVVEELWGKRKEQRKQLDATSEDQTSQFDKETLRRLVAATEVFWDAVRRKESELAAVRGTRTSGGTGGLVHSTLTGSEEDVETDYEDEDTYMELVRVKRRFRDEQTDSKEMLSATIRLERMKTRLHRGHGPLINQLVLMNRLSTPQPWSPSWQFPMQPMTHLEAEHVGSVTFGIALMSESADEMSNKDLWLIAFEEDSAPLPAKGWHSWRRHFRDGMRKLQAQGHLSGGANKMLRRKVSGGDDAGELSEIQLPFEVVDAPLARNGSGEFFVRAAIEFSDSGSFDVYSRFDDPLYLNEAPKLWPQQLSVGVEELASKDTVCQTVVTIAKEVAEYQVYENLEMRDENKLTPQELIAMRYFPKNFEYHVLTNKEKLQKESISHFCNSLADEAALNEKLEDASYEECTAAKIKAFEFMSKQQVCTAKRFIHEVSVVVESGESMTRDLVVQGAGEIMEYRNAELMHAEETLRKKNEVINKKDSDAANIRLMLTKVTGVNMELRAMVVAMQSQLRDMQAAGTRPNASGDRPMHPQATETLGVGHDNDGWSLQTPISGTAVVQDLTLDAVQKAMLLKQSQDLFANVWFQRPAESKQLQRNVEKRVFWQQMMRVTGQQWINLTQGTMYFDFLNAECITPFAYYAMYEVVVLNINPTRPYLYKDILEATRHNMVNIEELQAPWPFSPDITSLAQKAQDLIRGGRKPKCHSNNAKGTANMQETTAENALEAGTSPVSKKREGVDGGREGMSKKASKAAMRKNRSTVENAETTEMKGTARVFAPSPSLMA